MAVHMTTVLLEGAGTTGAAVAMGLASAASFATSNALQHRAAGTVPPAVHRVLAVLGHLARQRVWVVATCISFCALVLHALALRIGSIALVQPLMLVGVVLAVPVRSALEHKAPRRCEIRAVGVTAVGLTVFILSINARVVRRTAGDARRRSLRAGMLRRRSCSRSGRAAAVVLLVLQPARPRSWAPVRASCSAPPRDC